MSTTKSSKITVTAPQHRVLRALANGAKSAAGTVMLSRAKIKDTCFGGNSINLKPILDPLAKAKLIRSDEPVTDGKDGAEGRSEEIFRLTAAGFKASQTEPPASRRNGGANHQPLPKVGGTFAKTYKGKEIKVQVVADGFKVGAKTYPSLTAAAMAVRDSESPINGWAFFGLTK